MKCQYFKLLGCQARLDMMKMIIASECVCVCHFEEKLNLTQANVSKHIKLFRELGIVESRKCGKNVYYKLSNEFKENNQLLIDYIFEGECYEENCYPC